MSDIEAIDAVQVEAEARRPLARYNTGTINREACLYLRRLTQMLKPRVVVEVGTFIGSSTFSMVADRVYTCDKSNDCVPTSKRVKTHPFTGSTAMLSDLVKKGVKVDFFFFDGRIKDQDVAHIRQLSQSHTVYAFDDFEGREKGVLNVEKLSPQLSAGYRLVSPPEGTTIAVLTPLTGMPS